MDLGISGKRAAVAAASQGLGFATAAALAAAGVHVAICGRRPDEVNAAAERLGGGAVPLVADVSTAEGATGFVRDARGALGGIDILVANAGGPPAGDFEHTTIDQYLEAFKLNCLSSIAMCYEVVPEMRAQKWGRVVAITSLAVRQPMAGLILSNTSRAGLTGFLKTLAREVAADGVTVNSLLPGLHETERLTAPARRRIPRRPRREHSGTRARPARRLRPDRRVPLFRGGALRHGHRDADRRWRLRRTALMFRHIVLLRFTDDTTAKDVRALTVALNALPSQIPQIRDYRIGTDLGLAEENAHFAIVADFDDVVGYVAYRDDPEHQRVISKLIRPFLASRTAAQYEI